MEAVPSNAPSHRGKEVDLHNFSDNNHAGNKWNRRSRTRFLMFINKLRKMGIPLSVPTYIYEDNLLDIHNTLKPESTLKKKHNAIAYHIICESVVMHIKL